VSSSGLVFSVLVFIFQFSAKEAIPTFKTGNIFPALVNFIYVLNMRNKTNPNKLYIGRNNF
jgi:hypothetical protein